MAHATATSGPQLSSVVDSVCGSGTFAAVQSSGQEAYVDFQSGDAAGAIDADRKAMKISYACLLKPVKCSPGDSNCSPFDEIVAVYLRDRILSSQMNLWNELSNTNDSGDAMTVVTEAMRNAGDLCKYQHLLAETTPFTGARSDLTLAMKYASKFASDSLLRPSVEYQLDDLRQCARRLGVDVPL